MRRCDAISQTYKLVKRVLCKGEGQELGRSGAWARCMALRRGTGGETGPAKSLNEIARPPFSGFRVHYAAGFRPVPDAGLLYKAPPADKDSEVIASLLIEPKRFQGGQELNCINSYRMMESRTG